MYDQIADIYLEIFPLNQAFLHFLPDYLPRPGAAVLDLGCGPGDYVDTLARAGYQVTGIDSSAEMIAQAQAEKQGRFYPYAFDEIHQLAGTFDCIYCVGNSLSYLAPTAMPKFLADVYNLLKDTGNFILQVVNWDQHARMSAAAFPVNQLSAGRTFHRRYEWIDRGQVIFHTEIRQADEILGMWAAPLYPKYANPFAKALQAAGLNITGQLGDYQQSPFEPQSSPALICTAQK